MGTEKNDLALSGCLTDSGDSPNSGLYEFACHLLPFGNAWARGSVKKEHSSKFHSHLKEVEMSNFRNLWSEAELAIYLLNYATPLERMIINSEFRWLTRACNYRRYNKFE